MIIRVAAKDDLEIMAELLGQLFSIEADFIIEKEKQLAGLELLLKSETGVILVAEKDGGVVGMVTGQQVISTAEGGFSLLVEDMVVDKKHRRVGIGEKLLASLADWARKRGAHRMHLLADLDNQPAFDFYGKNDWTRTNLICLRKFTSN